MPNSSGGLFWGCIQDWLIITKPDVEVPGYIMKIRMSLINPFTRTEVVLPDTQRRILGILIRNSEISFDEWIPESKDWCRCGFDVDVPDDYVTDLICFKGCFYLLTKEYNIRVLDTAYAYSTIQTQSYKEDIDIQFYEIEMSPDVPREILILRYLVEFGDEILLAIRFIRNDFEETYDFKVFRLDMCKKEWVKLDSLGDCVMFLGRNCARCYSAKELGGDDMGNRIYFSNGCGLRRDMHMKKEFSCSLEKDDWGIFKLNSNGSERFSYLAKQGKRHSVWLTSPLWWYFNKFRP
ncbi:hypothetical protein Dsin_021493 [Dipteronia sinensis]|uniref:KIB1-4 beta-propeller domain-containing protein n=1 Tax=Dipteronia sinensis TaxID=43782 RepID=A0AAD9ZZW3_9ROSI|nr:hypothetical protein Dsin_021493 [Dipteronia sinensis]